MSDLELHEKIEFVQSSADLSAFVEELRLSLAHSEEDWENITLDHYLDAMGRWLGSVEQLCKNTSKELPSDVPWSLFAEILFAASIYEKEGRRFESKASGLAHMMRVGSSR